MRTLYFIKMATDIKIVFRGIRFLAIAVPLLFIGPTVIHSSFKNQNNDWYYVVLSVGILFCLFGMFLIFKGVNTMVKGIFND